MKQKSIGKAFSEMGHKAKRKKAEKRRVKVKELRNNGRTGPQIAAELGVKLRTVYQDFAILKRETEKSDADGKHHTANAAS